MWATRVTEPVSGQSFIILWGCFCANVFTDTAHEHRIGPRGFDDSGVRPDEIGFDRHLVRFETSDNEFFSRMMGQCDVLVHPFVPRSAEPMK